MSSIVTSAIPHYRADIDGLRAIAILLVLWFHAFPGSMPGGFIGVDVFFVISGFLITGIVLRGLDKGSFSFLHFYAQRARRLLPALAVVLPATLAAGWHWLWPQEYELLAGHVAAAAAFVLNIVLWTEAGYFDAATELKPLMHLWSLGIEEQFYLLYPCLLWAGWRFRQNPIVVIAGVVILSFIASLLTLSHDPAGAFFLPHTRFWELALGGCLAWWQSRPAAALNLSHQLLPWAGLAAIATGAWFIDPHTPYPGIAALLPVCGSLMLIASHPKAWVNRRLLANRGMVWIGLISYPLYLWHWPILSFMRIVHTDTPPLGMRWLAVGLSFLLAWLTFRFIETPVRFGARRGLRLAGTAGAVVSFAAAGLFIHAQHGVPARLPEAATHLLAYQYDYRDAYREGSCFLEPDQTAAAFARCEDTWPAQYGGWLLWGDSHAAHLYPGLRARYGAQAGLVQRTASGCPPLAGESIPNRPHCADIQTHIWKEIESHRPDRVTLAARWDAYQWQKLHETVERLRLLGVKEIQLIGPVPQWHNGLPRQVAIAYRENGFNAIPEKLATGVLPAPFSLDGAMREAADELAIEYFSPVQGFCDAQGCRVLSPQPHSALVAWDDAHLTTEGSIFLMSRWR